MGCLSLALWLPCPLASSWVWPENTGRKSEGGRRKKLGSLPRTSLPPCLVLGVAGSPSSIAQLSLHVGHSSLLLPLQA